MKIITQLMLLLALSTTLYACGQKTPLEIEKPVKVQEEVPQPTK